MTNKKQNTLKKAASNTALLFSFISLNAAIFCYIFSISKYIYVLVFSTLFFLSVFFLNKTKLFLLPRISFSLYANFLVFFFSLIFGKNGAVEYFLLVLLAMNFGLYSFNKERLYIYSLSALALITWFILYIYNFTLWNVIKISASERKLIYINVVCSVLLAIIYQLYVYTKKNLKYSNKLREVKKQAQENAEEKTNFLNTMSHEIRTPLNAINGLSYILKNNAPEKHQLTHLDSLALYGKQLMNLLNNVLDYSKYESNQIELELEPHSIAASLKESEKVYKQLCEDKGIIFNLILDDNIPDVYIDLKRFSEIINHLVYNSIQNTAQGDVRLIVKEIISKGNKITIEVMVKDSGNGISKENLDVILNTSSDISTLVTTNKKVGLGIPIVKNILKLMDSKIHIESKIGLGTTIKFPLLLSIAPEKVDTEVNSLDPKEIKIYGKKVLVVDDNKINILVAKQCLEKEGLDVFSATNGLEAVEKMQQDYFDIVLMDIQMPVLNGFEATKKIRTFNKNTPIFALSASLLGDIKDDLSSFGLNGLILKPFEPEELIAVLKKNIGYQ
ncbi:MAG: response regulator [Polaribacter sp.]